MKNYTELKITSNNPSAHVDFIGEWSKDDVEEEMRDIIEVEPKDDEWIHWVIEHAFMEGDGVSKEIYDAIFNDNVASITFFLYGAKLTVTKS